MDSSKRNDDKSYRTKLRIFLDKFIANAFTNDEKRALLFSPENMNIWVSAFTHNTYSLEDNYEALEYFGDRVLKSLFPIYLDQVYENLTNSVFTNLESVYMNGEYQGPLGKKIGFGPYIRSGLEKATLAIEGDIFESFFGALMKTANNIAFGSGFIICYNMFKYIFETYIEINFEEKKETAPKTKAKQIFTKFHGPNGKSLEGLGFVFDKDTRTGSVYINSGGIDLLQKMGILDPKKNYGQKIVIAKVRGGAEKVIEKEAFTKALEYLEKLGVTTEWAIEAKKKENLMKIKEKDANLYREFMKKCKEEGLIDPFFHTDNKADDEKSNLIQLRAYDENNKAILLVSAIKKASDPISTDDFRFNMIRKYVYEK